jgi:hypothetical protein
MRLSRHRLSVVLQAALLQLSTAVQAKNKKVKAAAKGRRIMTPQQEMTMLQSRSNRGSMLLALLGMGVMAQPFFAQDAANSSLVSSVAAASENLHPFTHFASIPATSEPATIKVERVKATKVFTTVKSTTDTGYCHDLQFRDPGGSMYCPSRREESPTPAYEVTYSFKGQPLAWDEYGNRNSTFKVYFRPEELPAELRKAISTGKVKRAELAAYFNLTISRLPVRAVVVDDSNSSLCGGNYVNGNWIQNDPKCQDKVNFKTVIRPSDYITVQVEPGSPR